MEAKPILLVRIPIKYISEKENNTYLMEAEQNLLLKTKNEYHILLMVLPINEPKLEVLNAKDMTETNFEELKALVNNLISKQ